jgi:cytoskeleton protein RodZ
MGSFGDKLRREREMRGVNLDEISESTKISRRHLESLEKEDFDSLPGGVFNKGFVRAYARYLGINEDQAVADYVAVAGDEPVPEDKFPLEIHQEPNRELNPRESNMPLLLAVGALVGVLIVYSLWAHHRKTHHAEAANASVAVQPVEAATPAAPAQGKAHEESALTARAVQRPVAAKNPQEEIRTARKKAAAEPRFFIVIKAKEDSWISVTADGKTIMQGVLGQDKKKFIRAGKEIVLKTGNAGGIEVSYNGKALGAIGSESETRTLTFTPQGPAQ